jgi:YVTN family beta-propeller protein
VAAPVALAAMAGPADAAQPAFGHVATICLPGAAGDVYAQAVAVDSDTNRIYAANSLGNDIVVIDGKTDKIVANIKGVKGPEDVAVDQATDTIYTANIGPAIRPGSVSVVSGVTHKLTATIKVGQYPQGIAVNPATGTVYVANLGNGTPSSGSVSVINGATSTVTGKIAIKVPLFVAANPVTNTVYISAFGHQGVVAVDGATDKITATIPRRKIVESVAVDQATDQVYTAYPWMGKIDGKTNTWLGSLPFPVNINPQSVAVDAATGRVYGADGPSGAVSVVNG